MSRIGLTLNRSCLLWRDEREDELAKELVGRSRGIAVSRATRADVYALKKWLGSKVSLEVIFT